MIKVIDPGCFTTVQDGGRWGYQAYGMPVAGALDHYAYRVVNLLAGNQKGAAVLEMTIRGGTFAFQKAGLVAFGGADMQARLDGVKVPNWAAVYVSAESVLAFGEARAGYRTYLAVRGGIETPVVLGSRSTYLRAAVGGMKGRALKPGDVLPAGRLSGAAAVPASLPADLVPVYGHEIKLKVILGPQDDLFADDGLHTFFESSYVVSLEADRMGYRLDGPKIRHRGPADIVSDALPEGAIQVPAHGRPIVMMADRQTTGGYPKIATVIGPCLPFLAQGRPGDRVRFQRSSDAEAVAALCEEEERYHLIQRFLDLNLHSHLPQEA